MKYAQYLFTFLMGYFIYGFIEVAGRGYTHWTMCITGGIALSVLYAINSNTTITLIKSCIIGAVIITCMEFIVGIFDNIIMGWKVWDYSEIPFNILGQICPLFSVIWGILCIPAFFICKQIRKRFNQ